MGNKIIIFDRVTSDLLEAMPCQYVGKNKMFA
jgi:hypothetical protein